jgi:gliding motility-associated-like protein
MAVLQSCIPSMDSISIIVAPRNDIPLDLGPDRVICPNNNIVLHAGPGFLSYLWSDGSTDSVFTATQPGRYFVEVTDSCGNLKKDTVTVKEFDDIINIGADRAKCNSDTVHLNAPAGYISYNWSNNYNISSTTAQQVIVNPAMDTAYYLAAEKYPGCFSYDTVRIKVNLSPPIVLGPDIVFCQGDSAVLDAGSGFAQYQWSNGSSVQQTAVYSTGSYSVIGTTTEGCKSYDTLDVVNVWTNPVVTLDENPELCTGDSRMLNAGNFSTYEWQNGSTASSFVVSGTGTYYVTVWDNHQCKGGDTVTITRMLPLPANFLPADTAICNYGNLLLKPTASFTNYAWNNSSVSSSISVTAPGIYWLEVTDANDCKGKDSVTVNPKECLTGFHIPTAFTPNHDGRNDVYKPFIGGIVKQYQFTIYNRWGQVIFTTKDLNKGWDGTFGGQRQDANVFTWMCTYLLEGEKVKREQGTVTLIR